MLYYYVMKKGRQFVAILPTLQLVVYCILSPYINGN